MRIMQLAPVWETVPPPAYGGTEVVVHVLTEELVRRGHDVTLWASGDSQTAGRHRWVVPRSLRVAGLIDEPMQYGLVHAAAALAERGEFDIIHNHNGPPSELGMAMYANRSGPPMLTTMHCMPAEATRFIWERYRGWYNAISNQQASVMPALPSAQFAGVVHNSIDVDSFPFRRDKEGYLLHMARLAPEKGAHLAVEAATRAGMRLILAGKACVPSEFEYFEQVLTPALAGTQALWVGEADAARKRELFAGARGFLVPLLWEEPFGLVMIEAMACGTPVIAYRRGAATEIVEHGRNGFLVDDVDGMVEAIPRLGEIDPAVCRRSVEDRFSPGALADRYLAVYNEILTPARIAPIARAAASNGAGSIALLAEKPKVVAEANKAV